VPERSQRNGGRAEGVRIPCGRANTTQRKDMYMIHKGALGVEISRR
jgi:hypothetical protein